MIEIVMVVCLHTAPTVCEERRLPPFNDWTAKQCVMKGQAAMARWVNSHPKFRIKRWTCRPSPAERSA